MYIVNLKNPTEEYRDGIYKKERRQDRDGECRELKDEDGE